MNDINILMPDCILACSTFSPNHNIKLMQQDESDIRRNREKFTL